MRAKYSAAAHSRHSGHLRAARVAGAPGARIQLLQAAGIDHVLEFSSVLRDLLDKVSMHENYTTSPTLQILRLMKRYKLVRDQQLEFAFPNEPPAAGPPPHIEAVVESDAEPGEDPGL